MNVEIRPTACGKGFECDWGTFDNSDGDPRRTLKPLMITTAGYAAELLNDGPRPAPHYPGVHSASRDGERLFAHLDHDGGRMTWELFEAQWWDNGGPDDVMIGRWPD